MNVATGNFLDKIVVRVKINNKERLMEVDTSNSISLISLKIFGKITPNEYLRKESMNEKEDNIYLIY